MFKVIVLILWLWLAMVNCSVIKTDELPQYHKIRHNQYDSILMKKIEVHALKRGGRPGDVVGGACIGAGIALIVIAFTRKRDEPDVVDDQFISWASIKSAYDVDSYNITVNDSRYKVTPLGTNKIQLLDGASIVDNEQLPELLIEILGDTGDYLIEKYALESDILDKRVDIVLACAGGALVAAGVFICYRNAQ